MAMSRKQKAAYEAAQAAARAAAQQAVNAAKAAAAAKPPVAAAAPAPQASAAAPAPAAPARVDPFFTPEDLAAFNDFTTRWLSDNEGIDFGLGTQRIDTDYQKGQTNKQAKQATNEGADQMAARGLFQSSIKDAALYDIEAQRALATKFLDDQMTSATLHAGTQKKILADSKTRFDTAMVAKQAANAQGVNDANNAAWADAMASYMPPAAAQPVQAAKPITSTVKPAAKPDLPAGTVVGKPKVSLGGTKLGTAKPKSMGLAKPKPKKLKAY